MAAHTDVKNHIGSWWRDKWNKNIEEFRQHVGSGGILNHGLANGSIPGFTEKSLSPDDQDKLISCEDGALNNPHPSSHPASMITGLANIAKTGLFSDLVEVPENIQKVLNGTADAATINGGVRVTIGSAPPYSPQANKELWVDTANLLLKSYNGTDWIEYGTTFKGA